MPHSKHQEYTANMQDITYTEVKMTKSPQKQRIPKAKKSPVTLNEEQVNYAELTFHRTPQLLSQKRVVRGKRQGTKATVWRMVTGILGALCVVLMTTVGILLPKLFSSQEEQSRKGLPHPLLCPKEDDGFCDLCSHDWIAFGNSCYHGFHGLKSHAESQSACEELNSHLVEIDSKAELENLLLFEIHGWILLKIDETEVSLLWENATKIEQTRINGTEKKSDSCPYLGGKEIYPHDCSSKKSYIYDSCDLCSHDWIVFGNNCYHGFHGIKSHAESQSACEELNSHLVEIDSKAELENLLLFEIHGWILLKIDETEVSLLWQNATKIEQTRINDSEKKHHSCPYLGGKEIYPHDCSSKKSYICESNIL